MARYFGLKKEAKLERFGEQGYAVVYFGIMGAWGYVRLDTCKQSVVLMRNFQRIMDQLPSFWYRTEHFWIGTVVLLSPSWLIAL